MHGTFKGAVYGDNAGESRLFTMDDFSHCMGFIIAGHVHIPGCYNKYFYYCGSPLRWKHGEEQEKGFLLSCINLDNMRHYVDFEPIESFKYITLRVDDIISEDPQKVIEYISRIKAEQNIDYIKIVFNAPVPNANKVILNNYYRSHDDVNLEFMTTQEENMRKLEADNQIDRFNFILDHNLSDEQIFVMYVNESEGYEFITVDKLHEILAND
jgi:DNA repair exonuclease SbcCD nuclease subunit